jgi:hypothetical protein
MEANAQRQLIADEEMRKQRRRNAYQNTILTSADRGQQTLG